MAMTHTVIPPFDILNERLFQSILESLRFVENLEWIENDGTGNEEMSKIGPIILHIAIVLKVLFSLQLIHY